MTTGTAPRRKPRLILMGEFSSGKSTLSNILLGGAMLPTQVTATRLPPVHVSQGDPSATAVTRDGQLVEVDPDHLTEVSPEVYRALHVTMQSDTLDLCDLVDMPGISDPNMPSDTWDDLVGAGDTVIWCTHATQAWRQSEAAAWDRMRPATSGQNLLLVTQFDKLRNPRDRARVMTRVRAETEGKFAAVYPVSLIDALAAGEDFDAWKDSGAHAFMEHLIEILLAHQPQAEPPAPPPAPEPEALAPYATALAEAFEDEVQERCTIERLDPQSRPDAYVVPRRVQGRPEGADRPRPPRPAPREALSAEPGVS